MLVYPASAFSRGAVQAAGAGADLMTQMATMATAMMQMQSQTIAILARHFINKEEQAKGRKPL
jgi:hypothetical protein